MLKKGNKIAVMGTAIEFRGASPPIAITPHKGCKETKVIWLSANTMVLNNNDVPINEDIAAALDLIPKLIRCARVDRSVDELAAWMRKRM